MADIIDEANERAERYRTAAIKQRKKEPPPANGFCHNCREPLADDQKFCDSDCMEDWEKRIAGRKRNVRGVV